jgi:2,3-bisphosphoglycerate-independent phosphoglycerate mutase
MISNKPKPIVLLVLDGWGNAPSWGGNAISVAGTPVFDNLWKNYPHTTLCASGECVGLPGHERGNSEVGHLNLGCGRAIKQDSSRITDSIKDETFFKNPTLIGAIEHAKKNNSNLHLMGLISDGGIHSLTSHLYALIELCRKLNFDHNHVFIHAFTDGRDSEPMSSLSTISHVQDRCKSIGVGQFATVSGRYFAMDRDDHWERTASVYYAMVQGAGIQNNSVLSAISMSYNQGITDEYIKATVITNNGKPVATVKDNDSMIFFNFRSDRARQIAQAFMAEDMRKFNRGPKIKNLYFVSMIPYGFESELKLDIKPAFKQDQIISPLASVLSANNLKQYHSAETEKYAHVTYFFNGGEEKPYIGEDRLLIPSPRIPTYDLKPEMSIKEVNNNAISRIKSKKYDFILVNFANPDMVGHTGNFKAALMACSVVDEELKKIVDAVLESKGVIFVTADHGNIEQMVNPVTGEPDTEHTRNPVPFILIGDKDSYIKNIKLRDGGILADVSPTVLEFLNIEKPKDMSGNSLISRV